MASGRLCFLTLVVAIWSMADGVAAAGTCNKKRTQIEIVLDDEGSIQKTGTQLGSYSCWMPKAAPADKDLCEDGHGQKHKFRITLENKCNVDVKLELELLAGTGSDLLEFEDCNAAKKPHDDVLIAGKKVNIDCNTKSYAVGSGRKHVTYALNATYVRSIAGDLAELNPHVPFDPEIILEEKGMPFMLIVLFVAGLAFLAVVWWVMTRRTNR